MAETIPRSYELLDDVVDDVDTEFPCVPDPDAGGSATGAFTARIDARARRRPALSTSTSPGTIGRLPTLRVSRRLAHRSGTISRIARRPCFR